MTEMAEDSFQHCHVAAGGQMWHKRNRCENTVSACKLVIKIKYSDFENLFKKILQVRQYFLPPETI